MGGDVVTRFIRVSKMSSARTDVTMSQISDLAAEVGDARLAELADAGRESARATAEIEHRYRIQTPSRGVARVDRKMDAAVVGLFDGLVKERDYLIKARDPLAERFDRFLHVHFLGQVSTITRAPYEEELQRVEAMHAELTGTSAELVAEAGLERWIARIEQHLPEYRAALAARTLVTGGDLASARRDMHRATCAVVGHVVSRYIGQDDVIARLLTPLIDQQDRIAAIMRARRQGAGTGSEEGLDDLIEGDGEDTLDGVDDFDDDFDAEFADDMDGAEAGAGGGGGGDAGGAGSGGGSGGGGGGAEGADAERAGAGDDDAGDDAGAEGTGRRPIRT